MAAKPTWCDLSYSEDRTLDPGVFCQIVVLGTLLEPMLAETFNTTDAFITATPELQTQNPADRNHSLDVSNATGVYDVNMTRSENSTISGTQMPPVEVYVIVLILVIVGVAVIGIIFFCVKSNRKRFSVDVHAKHEDAQIPLASVEPEMCDRSQAPTDGDQQLTESPAKSQTSESPAEKKSVPNIVDDADPTASTKTSVETLNDVLNENNSNNNPGADLKKAPATAAFLHLGGKSNEYRGECGVAIMLTQEWRLN
ncbi:hypothetical protein Baya_1834 [Bagarius yarrelli]|uniref:Uncharacterized protein n=1 Tax=Bagarius yarrelli TaxID=175774 RepID=A0A556TM94_BAGYA|nr:hypothetical protein Baya_1834 [Bagarius yarrelli]